MYKYSSMTPEQWKPINGFENYEISNHGKVNSLDYGEELIPHISRGYYHVSLHDYDLIKKAKIHRLVAEHFIPNPEDKAIVNHKDGNKLNNHIDNLEWMSHSENTMHSFYELKDPRMTPVEQYSLDGELIDTYRSRSEAVRATGISRGSITSNLAGKTRHGGGYVWKYKSK